MLPHAWEPSSRDRGGRVRISRSSLAVTVKSAWNIGELPFYLKKGGGTARINMAAFKGSMCINRTIRYQINQNHYFLNQLYTAYLTQSFLKHYKGIKYLCIVIESMLE